MADPPRTPATPPAGPTVSGRCHFCGYRLERVPDPGQCSECGTPYTAATATRLQPWPGAFEICLRLGWPLVGLMLIWLFALGAPGIGLLLAYPLLVAVPLNSYFQVRRMLKRSLPEQTRTRGPVAVLRSIGTTICVLLLLVFVVVPLGFGVVCLVILSGADL